MARARPPSCPSFRIPLPLKRSSEDRYTLFSVRQDSLNDGLFRVPRFQHSLTESPCSSPGFIPRACLWCRFAGL